MPPVFFNTSGPHIMRIHLVRNSTRATLLRNSKKCFWPVTGLRNRGPLKDLNDSKWIAYESKWFPWSSWINFIPFRIFRGPLFRKLATVSYSKPALERIYYNVFPFLKTSLTAVCSIRHEMCWGLLFNIYFWQHSFSDKTKKTKSLNIGLVFGSLERTTEQCNVPEHWYQTMQ